MVHYPTRGAHNHLGAAFELAQLAAHVAAAVNRQYVKVVQLAGIALKRFGHLNGQLAGRCQHQNLRLALLGVEAREQGQGKRGGFTGAGLGHAHDVFAIEQGRNGGRLDRRGLFVADGLNGLKHGFRQAQVGKQQGGLFGHGVLASICNRRAAAGAAG